MNVMSLWKVDCQRIDSLRQKTKSRKEPFKLTARMKGYTAVPMILVGITGLLFIRSEVEAVILRLPGQLFQHKGKT
jgi:hypothetical protein